MSLIRNLSRLKARPVISGVMTVILLGVSALLSVSISAGPLRQSGDDMDHLKMLSGKDFETDFLSMMIQHHQSALDMAKLVPDRANHQEVKDAAQKIISDQTREIADMTGWLQQWYNMSPKQGMMHNMPGMGMSDMMNLQSLKGDEFDKQFLTMMRMHHMGAVEMAGLVPDRATHAELKTLGQNIISSQSAEIQQFESWLKTWYNLDVAGGAATPPDKMPSGSMSGGASPNLPATGSGNSGTDIVALASLMVLAAIAVAGGIWARKRA